MFDPVATAEHLARAAHAHQHNSTANEPYIRHPERVAVYVEQAYRSLLTSGHVPMQIGRAYADELAALTAAGWLHDTVEDTWVTPNILREVFPQHITSIVEPVLLVSRNYPDAIRDEEYYGRIKDDPRALVLKGADMMDNGDPIRLAKIRSGSRRTRLTQKYDHAAEVLGIEEEFAAWKSHRMTLPEWDLLSARS